MNTTLGRQLSFSPCCGFFFLSFFLSSSFSLPYLVLLTVGLTEIAASHAAGRETSSKLGRSRTSEGYGHDKDDDWLDSMLSGR